MENKCILHKPILRAIHVPKIIKVGGNLTTFWRKQFCTVFFGTWCIWQIRYTSMTAVLCTCIRPMAAPFSAKIWDLFSLPVSLLLLCS